MRTTVLNRLTVCVILMALSACALGEPREPSKAIDEISDGPGLFSGEDGEFVIYRH